MEGGFIELCVLADFGSQPITTEDVPVNIMQCGYQRSRCTLVLFDIVAGLLLPAQLMATTETV